MAKRPKSSRSPILCTLEVRCYNKNEYDRIIPLLRAAGGIVSTLTETQAVLYSHDYFVGHIDIALK